MPKNNAQLGFGILRKLQAKHNAMLRSGLKSDRDMRIGLLRAAAQWRRFNRPEIYEKMGTVKQKQMYIYTAHFVSHKQKRTRANACKHTRNWDARLAKQLLLPRKFLPTDLRWVKVRHCKKKWNEG